MYLESHRSITRFRVSPCCFVSSANMRISSTILVATGISASNQELTPLLNLLVIIPKGEHNIRSCVDMHAVNKAITRTRYPTPSVDDLLVK